VPRQKFGVFGEMYKKWMDDNPGATHEELRNEAQQIWNRVDSRLGQVVYDRLFMHNVTKNFAQMMLRAPGWTGGTILEVGGGMKDLIGFVKNPKAGLTDRAAYTASMLITTAIVNAVLTTMFTGEPPDDWKDLVAFRTGNLDDRGDPERFMLPTYMKDVYAYAQNGIPTTLQHKTHPLLQMVGDIIKNRDYYDTEIRSEDENWFVQMAQTAGFVAKSFVPFWIQGLRKEEERGGNLAAKAAPFIGIMPAPSALNKTAAEKLMSEYGANRLPQGTRTKEETEKTNLKREMYVALRKNDKLKALELFNEGKKELGLTLRDWHTVTKSAKNDPLENSFKRLSLPQAKRVMDVANDEEKRRLARLYLKKVAANRE